MKKILTFITLNLLLFSSCKKYEIEPDPATVYDAINNVIDVDGNIYKTIKIGTQVWMAENLKVTKYKNGDLIPNVTNISAWPSLTTGTWCCYNNNNQNNSTYGKLYNWYSVNDSRGLAPAGWHIPTDADWVTLLNHVHSIGDSLKEIGTTNWISPNTGTNSTGFTARPGGELTTTFSNMGSWSYWWSSYSYNSTPTYAEGIYLNNYSQVNKNPYAYKYYGYSVRCIKD